MKLPLDRLTLAGLAALVIAVIACGTEQQSVTPTGTAPLAAQPVDAESISHEARFAATASPETVPTATRTVTAAEPAPTLKPLPTVEGCHNHGYAGKMADRDDNSITIYLLTDPPEDPADAAKYVSETVCIAGGRWMPPADKTRVIRADYTLRQLKYWYDLMREYTWQVDGLFSSGVHEAENKVLFNVKTELGRRQLEEAVLASGVPREAVMIKVRKQIGLNDPPIAPYAKIGIELSIEFPVEVEVGDGVVVNLVLTNNSDETIEVEHGYPPEVDVVVLTSDGDQVWRHQPPIIMGVGGSSEVKPGDELRFPVSWTQVDDDGQTVPAGEYFVRGFARFVHYQVPGRSGYAAIEGLSTAPQPMRITGEEEQP